MKVGDEVTIRKDLSMKDQIRPPGLNKLMLCHAGKKNKIIFIRNDLIRFKGIPWTWHKKWLDNKWTKRVEKMKGFLV